MVTAEIIINQPHIFSNPDTLVAFFAGLWFITMILLCLRIEECKKLKEKLKNE